MSFKLKYRVLMALMLLLAGYGLSRSISSLQTLPKNLSLSAIDLYQQKISSVAGGPDCAFHPSCSNYSKEAVEKHGLAKGLAMSFDRLTRCNNEVWIYPEVLVEEELKKYDPVPSEDAQLF